MHLMQLFSFRYMWKVPMKYVTQKSNEHVEADTDGNHGLCTVYAISVSLYWCAADFLYQDSIHFNCDLKCQR